MQPKTVFWFITRVIYLTCAMLFCFAVGTFGSGLAPISMLTEAAQGSSEAASGMSPWQAFVPLLIYSFVIACLFGYIVHRSRWHGLKLAVFIFVSFFGVMTVVGQLESLLFLQDQLPAGMVGKIFLQGVILAGLFSPLAVMIMGKTKRPRVAERAKPRRDVPLSEWLWKVVFIGFAYLILYLVFGYFVAWKSPVLQQYYGGTDPGNFFVHLLNLWNTSPYVFPFQIARGLLWMLFALPIIRMHKGGKLEVAFTLALLLAFWSFQLLIPNPFMPAEVARVHLVEIFGSNFIFGFIIGLLLTP